MMFSTVYKSAQIFLIFCHNIHTFDGLTDRRTEFSSLYRICIPCSAAKTKMAISSNYVVHVAIFWGHLSHKIRKNEQTNTAQEVKMHDFKISVGQKVVGQTSWLAHWEQKVGGQLPALPNRLLCQCSSDCSQSSEKVSRVAVNPYRLALRKILFKRPTLSILM